MSRWIVTEPERSPLSRTAMLWMALAALPWALLMYLVVRYGMDLPILDEWTYLPIIERSCTGTLTFGQLWAQYAEHRPIFPLLVMLFFVHTTGWNIHYELVLTVLLATLYFFVLVRLYRRQLPDHGTGTPWLWALLSLVVFSLSQWEVWLWGAQVQMFLNVLGVTTGVLFLTRRPLGWKELAIASVFGILATYSFGNGLLFWPIGLILVAVAPETRRPRWLLATAWLLVSAAIIGSYLLDFRLERSATLESVLNDPVNYVRYFLTYLGSPVASFSGSAWPPRDSGVAALVGAAGCLLLLYAIRRTIRTSGDPKRLLPFLALAAYAVGSGLLATRSRSHFGIPQAYASRYTTISSLFWIGTIGALAMSVAYRDRPSWFQRTSLGAIALLILVSSLSSVHEFPERNAILLPARDEMSRGDNSELLKRLHPDLQVVRSGIVLLRHLSLSVFRNQKRSAEALRAGPGALTRFGQIIEPLFRPEAVRADMSLTVPVRVTNPTIEIWPATGDETGTLPVHLSYHWFDQAGRAVVVDGKRANLPRDVRSGETVYLTITAPPPPLPGHYILRLTMVQEGVGWFDAVTGGAADLSVDVIP